MKITFAALLVALTSSVCLAGASPSPFPPMMPELPANPHPDIPSITNRIAVAIHDSIGDPPAEPSPEASEAEWAKYREQLEIWENAAYDIQKGIIESLTSSEKEVLNWERITERIVEESAEKDARWKKMFLSPMSDEEKARRIKSMKRAISEAFDTWGSYPARRMKYSK